jgi:hypothetical protein
VLPLKNSRVCPYQSVATQRPFCVAGKGIVRRHPAVSNIAPILLQMTFSKRDSRPGLIFSR